MAIPIPNPPTDNLYKFIAIAGLILTLFCLALILFESERLEKSARLVEIQSKQLDGLTEIIEFKIDLAEGIQHQENHTKLLENIQADLNKYSADFKEHVETVVEAPKQTSDKKKKLGYFGVFLGLLLSAFGFTMWYFKVQRYLDEILKIELKNKKLDSLTK